MEGLTGLPAHRLARMLRAREVSAAELLAAHLDRLEAVNPLVNAVVRLAPDAMDRASAADQALARGEQPARCTACPSPPRTTSRPRGVVTAIGVPGRAGPTPETTATVTAAAGALASAGAAVEEARPPGDGHALTVEVWRSYGPGMGSQELYRLLRRWDSYRAELGAWMASWDAILTRRDDLALALAAHLETAIGGWRPSPL